MLAYIFLAIAIITEVIATIFLKFTAGENPKWWAYAVVVTGYASSFFMLSLALRNGMPLAIGYAIWSAVGVIIVSIASWLFFKESLSTIQIIGMALVIVGVGLLELGAAQPQLS